MQGPPDDHNYPYLQVERASLVSLTKPTPKTALLLLTHAQELSDIPLRACLNYHKHIPTIALDMLRSVNTIAMDPLSMVLGNFPLRKFILTGLPKSGKSTVALVASRRRRLAVKTPKGSSFQYRMIQPASTFVWQQYEIQTQSKLAEMRPLAVWDPPSNVSMDQLDDDENTNRILQAVGCIPMRSIDKMEALQILLDAIHLDASMSGHNPTYYRKLHVSETLESAVAFREAAERRGTDHLDDLILECRKGEYGRFVFGELTSNEGDESIKLHRGTPVVGYNEAALELLEQARIIQKEQSDNNVTDSRKRPKPHKSEQQQPHESNVSTSQPQAVVAAAQPAETEMKDKPATRVIMFPHHRRCYHCMMCANFIKIGVDKRYHGCGHTKTLTQRYEWIVAYFSRMTEAFGNTNHVRYLMRDSLACTIMRKHGLRSRAAVYKKFGGLVEYPMPNELRPRFLRSDQPIPYVPRCIRVGTKHKSCFDTHAARLLDTIPNYLARANQVELDKEDQTDLAQFEKEDFDDKTKREKEEFS